MNAALPEMHASPQGGSEIAHIPCNIEAEQALLGAILFDNAAYERITDRLQGRHFFEPFHQRLYSAMEEYIRKGQLAEPIVLQERFRRDPAFDQLGGLSYLADLVGRAPPAANAPDYARVIYDLALRRDLIRIGGDIASEAMTDVDRDAREQIEIAEQQLYTLAESGATSSGFQTFADALHGAVEMTAEAFNRDGGLAGVSTGLTDLDKKLGGLHPSDLLILAGRPSMGKTALATNIAFNVARTYAWEPQADGTRKTVNGGIVAFFVLNMLELTNDGSVCAARDDQLGHRRSLALSKSQGPFLREVHLIHLLGQTAVVVHVALRHAASVESFRDDRVSHAQTKQLGVLQVPKGMGLN